MRVFSALPGITACSRLSCFLGVSAQSERAAAAAAAAARFRAEYSSSSSSTAASEIKASALLSKSTAKSEQLPRQWLILLTSLTISARSRRNRVR